MSKKGLEKKDVQPRDSAWKPRWIRLPYLSCLALFSAGLLVCVEVLRQKCKREQGIGSYTLAEEIPRSHYFAYNYVPTILATVFTTLWALVDLNVKRLEPFTQISNRRDFPFKLLFLDYASESPILAPLRALYRRHWAVAVTSFTYLLISLLLAPSQSTLFSLQEVQSSGNISSVPSANNRNATQITLIVNDYFAYISESVLGVSILACIITFLICDSRESLLRSDPESLASIMTLIKTYFANQKNASTLEHVIDTTSTVQFRNYMDKTTCCWTEVDSKAMIEFVRENEAQSTPVRKVYLDSKQFFITTMGLAISLSMLVLIILGLAFIASWTFSNKLGLHWGTISVDPSSGKGEKFDQTKFDATSLFTFQFLPTLVANLIGIAWTSVHRDLTVLEPWLRLHKGARAQESLSLSYVSRPACVVFVKAFMNRHYMLCFISLVCASTSVLSVSMGGLLSTAAGRLIQSTDRLSIQISVQVSLPALLISLLLLSVYVIAIFLIFFRRRKRVSPRMPKSLGSILPWVLHSRMLQEFQGTENLSSSLRAHLLQNLNHEYMFGWFRDSTGQIRLGVEIKEYIEREWSQKSYKRYDGLAWEVD